MSPHSLRFNLSWMVLGRVSYTGALWGILIVLAHAGPETVGTYALALALTAPVFALTNLQLRIVFATDTQHEQPFGIYASQRLLCTGFGALVIAGIMSFTDYESQILVVTLLVGMCKAIESFSDLVYGLFLQRERMEHLAHSLLLRGPLLLPFYAAVMWFTENLILGVALQLLVWTLVFLFHDLPQAARVLGSPRELLPRWERARLWQLTRRAAPLGPVGLTLSLVQNIPRYVIEHVLGVAMLGVYASLAYLLQAGHMVVQALGTTVTPRLAVYFASSDLRSFFRLLFQMTGACLLIGAVGVIVAWVGGGQVLTLVYGPEFAAHTDLLVVIMIAGGIAFLSWFANNVLNAMRLFAHQLPLAGSVLVAIILSCLWAVPRYGAVGAAWSWGLAGAVHVLLACAIIGYGCRQTHEHS